MLHLNLNALERSDALRLSAAFPAAEFAREGWGPEPSEPVRVRMTARCTASGQVAVRGRMSTVLAQACRRCLEPATRDFELPIRFFFVPEDEPGVREDDGEVRTFAPHLVELDLSRPLREEFALAAPLYVECRPGCRGLCPACGSNRNEVGCECTTREFDARWEKLRILTNH